MTGERRAVTLVEVAEAASVSVATASNALSGSRGVSAALTARVHEAAKQLGYRRNHAASSLRTGQTHTIGVVIPDVTNPFFAELVKAMGAAADALGLSVLLCDSAFDPSREARYLARLTSAADGVLLCSTRPGDAPVGELLAAGVPVVACDEPVDNADVGLVAADNVGGAVLAARHLFAAGGRQFGLITGPETLVTARERERGFVDALSELGVDLPVSRRVRMPYSLEGGRAGIEQLLTRHPEVDAVFACTDLQAIGAVFESASLGRSVPDDLLVCGFDGIPWGERTRPSITTVAQDVSALARLAVEQLVALIRADAGPSRTRVPVRLIERESTSR